VQRNEAGKRTDKDANTIIDPGPFIIVPPTLDVVQDQPTVWDCRLVVAYLAVAFVAWYLL
jgi:hypothetical protein